MWSQIFENLAVFGLGLLWKKNIAEKYQKPKIVSIIWRILRSKLSGLLTVVRMLGGTVHLFTLDPSRMQYTCRLVGQLLSRWNKVQGTLSHRGQLKLTTFLHLARLSGLGRELKVARAEKARTPLDWTATPGCTATLPAGMQNRPGALSPCPAPGRPSTYSPAPPSSPVFWTGPSSPSWWCSSEG